MQCLKRQCNFYIIKSDKLIQNTLRVKNGKFYIPVVELKTGMDQSPYSIDIDTKFKSILTIKTV